MPLSLRADATTNDNPVSANAINMIADPAEYDISKVKSHASILIQEGSWCSPNCIAQCGSLILMNEQN